MVLNFGSINIDHVYTVQHFVRPGETIASRGYRRFPGGKGFNQSVALARAGASVAHAGAVGQDGLWLVEYLRQCGVATERIAVMDDAPTGNAIIQVDENGQNAILLEGGANQRITAEAARAAVAPFGAGDLLLTQNETAAVPDLLRAAKARGMTVAFNPAPMDAAVLAYPLDLVDILIVNEIEGAAIATPPHRRGEPVCSPPHDTIVALRERFPQTLIALTLGKDGAIISEPSVNLFHLSALPVTAVDTTAAGDCFIGYFLAALAENVSPRAAAAHAINAAAP
ncbi:MAG: ribokinase, partial [Kiritimatiellaeota bacterium]|nr:ribokinase [Kiritimatiellota bacterium]